MALLIWLIYLATSWGLADLLTRPAYYYIPRWEKHGLKSATLWQSVHTQLNFASYLDPHHPNLLEIISKVHYLHHFAVNTTVPLSSLQKALDYNFKAVQQRPVSAYTWANIALLKSQLKQYDAQFETALKQAIVLGRWETMVQRLVAEIGLVTWYQLPKSTRWLVLATIERGMYIQPDLISAIMKKHYRTHIICGYIDLHKDSNEFTNTLFNDHKPVQLMQFCQQHYLGELKQ